MINEKPLYNRGKDIAFFNVISNELVNKIITTPVVIYKVSTLTETDIYGEGEEKIYTKGICIGCLISHEEQTTDASDGFGPDIMRNIKVAFHREMIAERNFYPEIGDLIEWDQSYFEIDSIVENQLVGGSEYKNFSIVCNAHMSSRDKLNIENVRMGDGE